MLYLNIFIQFFQIGLLSFGGGYATLPFLYHLTETANWYSVQQLSNMIALSSVTPGPVGVNVATFAGFMAAGIQGAILATFSVILPSYIIVIAISKFLEKFKHNKDVQAAIYALKPAGCGLLAAVAINMFANLNLIGMLFLGILFYISLRLKKDPLFYLAFSAIFGCAAGIVRLIT